MVSNPKRILLGVMNKRRNKMKTGPLRSQLFRNSRIPTCTPRYGGFNNKICVMSDSDGLDGKRHCWELMELLTGHKVTNGTNTTVNPNTIHIQQMPRKMLQSKVDHLFWELYPDGNHRSSRTTLLSCGYYFSWATKLTKDGPIAKEFKAVTSTPTSDPKSNNQGSTLGVVLLPKCTKALSCRSYSKSISIECCCIMPVWVGNVYLKLRYWHR